MKTLPISSPIYRRRQRVRNWCGEQCPLSLAGNSTARRMLRRRLPTWTRADHARQALAMERAAHRCISAWSREAEAAALETFGRPWQFTDYRISGIGSDEFTAERKERLRTLAHRRSDYLSAADLHRDLAGVLAMRRARKEAAQPFRTRGRFLAGAFDPRGEGIA